MHILILNWRCIRHPFTGGAEVSLMEHAKYWAKMGNEVVWFTSNFKGGKKKEAIEGVTFVRYGSHFTVHFYAFLQYIKGGFSNVDIIVDCFHFIPFFSPIYIRNKKIISIAHEVAGNLWFENLRYPLAYIGFKLEPLFFKIYKRIPFIVVSESTKKDLLKVDIPSKNIHVIHNGNKAQIVSKTPKEKMPTLLFMGRISKDKGIEDAVRAYKEIRSKNKEVRLWIVGKEEKSGYLKELLSSYSIEPELVHYFGFVSEEKKNELLKRAWILMHPSKKEGWGLTVIEAASQGTPTVGYDVEGLRDSILNNKTGLLTDTNAESLAKGVLTLLNDKKLYARLSKESINWSNKFDWKESVKKSYELLLDVRYKIQDAKRT